MEYYSDQKAAAANSCLVETYSACGYVDRQWGDARRFSLIMLKTGILSGTMDNIDFYIEAPALICMNESNRMDVVHHSIVLLKIVIFDPCILHSGLTPHALRHAHEADLCVQHAAFQLSPFLSNDLSQQIFSISQEILRRLDFLFDQLDDSLNNEENRSLFQSRSYFVDIIGVIEKVFCKWDVYEAGHKDRGPCDGTQDRKSPVISQELRDILGYINEHLDETHTLESINNRFYINKNKIEGLFKAHLQTTFNQYLKRRRFEEASRYLQFTELDGAHIASRNGISSSQNFCKFFKQMAGISPNEFRRESLKTR